MSPLICGSLAPKSLLLPPFRSRLSASPTLPGPHSLSPILRGGGGSSSGSKEFAADRCIARRQTHARPCAGQFPPECPKSHIPSIISSTEKTDGIINEHCLIGGQRGCLPRSPHSHAQAFTHTRTRFCDPSILLSQPREPPLNTGLSIKWDSQKQRSAHGGKREMKTGH